MICGLPVQDDFYRTVCVLPRNHPQRFHMDAADYCVWCDRLVRPEGRGEDSPARNEQGVFFHRACLFALDGERLGIRRVAA